MTHPTQKIIPHLWFDDQAEQAVQFYTSLFPNSSTHDITRYGKAGFEIHGQPEGRVMTIEYELSGYKFIALNGGPLFRFTPAISFFVTCETEQEVDYLWQRLVDGGAALMPLDEYAWSKKYGWVQDRYGLTWQISLGTPGVGSQKIIPALMYTRPQDGKAEPAIQFYTTIFKDSSISAIFRYDGSEGEPAGTVKHARFTLNGEPFIAMDSSQSHAFTFNEAISLLIDCDSQEEVDYFWQKLSEHSDPTTQQCGWLKDQFGVFWQVNPAELRRILQDPDVDKVARVTEAFLQMKKLDMNELRKVYNGR